MIVAQHGGAIANAIWLRGGSFALAEIGPIKNNCYRVFCEAFGFPYLELPCKNGKAHEGPAGKTIVKSSKVEVPKVIQTMDRAASRLKSLQNADPVEPKEWTAVIGPHDTNDQIRTKLKTSKVIMTPRPVVDSAETSSSDKKTDTDKDPSPQSPSFPSFPRPSPTSAAPPAPERPPTQVTKPRKTPSPTREEEHPVMVLEGSPNDIGKLLDEIE